MGCSCTKAVFRFFVSLRIKKNEPSDTTRVATMEPTTTSTMTISPAPTAMTVATVARAARGVAPQTSTRLVRCYGSMQWLPSQVMPAGQL